MTTSLGSIQRGGTTSRQISENQRDMLAELYADPDGLFMACLEQATYTSLIRRGYAREGRKRTLHITSEGSNALNDWNQGVDRKGGV